MEEVGRERQGTAQLSVHEERNVDQTMNKLKPTSRRKILGLTGFSALMVPAIIYRFGHAAEDGLDEIDQPSTRDDAAFLARAFDMQHKATVSGDQSYGAVVVKNLAIVGQSPSRVIVNHDPTAHAEMEAIRDAANRLGNRNLTGCTLFSSSKACPMCEAAAYWAGVSRMVYGETGNDGGRPGLC